MQYEVYGSNDKVTLVSAAGELKLGGAGRTEADVSDMLRELRESRCLGKTTAIDMSGVEFASREALCMLAEYNEQARTRGGELIIANLSLYHQRVLRIIGLSEEFPILATKERPTIEDVLAAADYAA